MPPKRRLTRKNLPYIADAFSQALSAIKELDHAMYFYASEDHPMRLRVGDLYRRIETLHAEFAEAVKRKEQHL